MSWLKKNVSLWTAVLLLTGGAQADPAEAAADATRKTTAFVEKENATVQENTEEVREYSPAAGNGNAMTERPEETKVMTIPEHTGNAPADRTIPVPRETETGTASPENNPAGTGSGESSAEPVKTGGGQVLSREAEPSEEPGAVEVTTKLDTLEPQDFSLTANGYPLHLNGDPNYVFVWGNKWSADYIRRDSLKMVRHSAPYFYEITVEVAYVGDILEGNRKIASTKTMGFEYYFGPEERRLLYSPQELDNWVYIDADNNRGSNAERKAIGEMAYYLLFGRPFYGYMGNYDSNFYASSGKAGLRGVAPAGTEEGNSFYVCPGTIRDTTEGFSVFVKIGPNLESLADYILEFNLMEGSWYYSFYIQNQPAQWNFLERGTVFQRIWQIANYYRK